MTPYRHGTTHNKKSCCVEHNKNRQRIKKSAKNITIVSYLLTDSYTVSARSCSLLVCKCHLSLIHSSVESGVIGSICESDVNPSEVRGTGMAKCFFSA